MGDLPHGNYVVKDCRIGPTKSGGIRFRATAGTISGNSLTDIAADADAPRTAEAIMLNAKNTTVENNSITRVGGAGLYARSGPNR